MFSVTSKLMDRTNKRIKLIYESKETKNQNKYHKIKEILINLNVVVALQEVKMNEMFHLKEKYLEKKFKCKYIRKRYKTMQKVERKYIL